ncbi:MAG TPA: aspartyl protease family protein, partial [Rhizomicrobium sp.]
MHRVLAALALSVTPALADGNCVLKRVASLDMSIEAAGLVTVPMTVGGRKADMLVDTGGALTSLDTDIVTAEKMEVDPFGNGRYLEQFGGTTISKYAVAHDVALGGMKADKFRFAVQPHTVGFDGVLAADVLRSFDVEFDFANAALNLFSPDRCAGKIDYWAPAAELAEIPIKIDKDGHIQVTVQVDGKSIDAMLDTGAGRTVASLEMMRRLFDIDEKSPDLQPDDKEDPPSSYGYPFKALSFGGVAVSHPDIVLVP